MEDEAQIVETVTVFQRKGGCCIHQTVTTTLLIQTTDQKLGELVAAALRQIDDSDYNLVAEQVTAIEAVVAQVKEMGAVMSRKKNRVEKLETELAELKRELERERCKQDRWPSWGKMLVSTAAGVLLSDGVRSKLRGVRDLLNLILDK